MDSSLFGQILLHHMPKLNVTRDPAPNMFDKRQAFVQGLVDVVAPLFLLMLLVDGRERVAHRTSGPAFVLGLLSPQIEDVLAWPDAQGVAHYIHHGIRIQGCLL